MIPQIAPSTYCNLDWNEQKVGIKLYKMAISCQNIIPCFLTFYVPAKGQRTTGFLKLLLL